MSGVSSIPQREKRNAVFLCPYGYLASKENKGEWVIDEEAAAVVRRIFHSVVAGESIASIARALRAEKIPIPSEHWKRIGAPVRSAKYTDPYAWSTTTISYILKRPEYTGRKVLGKTVCENYKTKSTRKTAPEEQYMLDYLMPRLAREAGATETLKAADPMKWVGLMNNCKARAEEIIRHELIYV